MDTKEKPRIKNQYIASLALAILVVVALVYIGIRFEQSRQPQRLPANIACSQLAEKTPIYYQAIINHQFGEPIPEDAPTKTDIETLEKDCNENIGRYEIEVTK